MTNTSQKTDVRVRFAPSPTGFLHIGGARTALFNWLFARHHGGRFILRIEDTDRERSRPELTQGIIDGLRFLGLEWDEGPEIGGEYGPYLQSERGDIYRAFVEKAIEKGCVYRCYCTKDELDTMRKLQVEGKSRTAYDRRWRDRPSSDWPEDQPYTLRFKMPLEGETVIEDRVQGRVAFQNEDLEDFIVARADGSPTYNFCVVADDVNMRISHVVRGVDHLANTALQLNIYKALGCTPPTFSHVGLIHGPDGAKYSKRHGAVDVLEWRKAGYLPEALRNYLVRLGWAHGDDEIFSTEELIRLFDLDGLSKSKAVVNLEKLDWINQQYIVEAAPAQQIQWLMQALKEYEDIDATDDSRLEEICRHAAPRAKTLRDLAQTSRLFFVRPNEYEPKAVKKHVLKGGGLERLKWLYERFADLDVFDETSIEAVFEHAANEFEVKLLKLAQPVRVALTGTAVSPGIYETLALVGKDESLERIRLALETFA